jgi:hypothetical protein
VASIREQLEEAKAALMTPPASPASPPPPETPPPTPTLTVAEVGASGWNVRAILARMEEEDLTATQLTQPRSHVHHSMHGHAAFTKFCMALLHSHPQEILDVGEGKCEDPHFEFKYKMIGSLSMRSGEICGRKYRRVTET